MYAARMGVGFRPAAPGVMARVMLAATPALACSFVAPPPSSNALTIAVPGDVTGIYPQVRNESYTFAVMANAFEGLTRFDRDLRLEPAVAARWENPSDRTWVFQLRPGLRFSDGQPVRVTDVVASLRLALAEDVTRHMLQDVETVEPAGADGVRITTRGASPTLLTLLAQAFVLPEHGLRLPPSGPPAGTGPYAIASWEAGRELVLRRNPYYRDARARFDQVTLRVMPSASDRTAALQEGTVQVAEGLPLDQLERLRGRPDIRVVSRPGLRVLFLGMRMDDRPFSDPRVREAFDLALDRRVLIERALGGYGTPASQVVPPTVAGHNPQLVTPPPDAERARRLLGAAGLEGLEVRLDGPRNRYVNDVAIMEEVARQLAEVGVRVNVNALEKERFFPLLGAPETRFYLIGWSCDGADAGNALGSLFHSPTASGFGFENSQGLADPVLDRLIEAAEQAANRGERLELLRHGLARAAEIRPVLPLVIQHESLALSSGVAWEPPLDMALRLHDARPAGARAP